MDKQDWIDRCARKFSKLTLVDMNICIGFAEGIYEEFKDEDVSPEEAAEIEVDYWSMYE